MAATPTISAKLSTDDFDTSALEIRRLVHTEAIGRPFTITIDAVVEGTDGLDLDKVVGAEVTLAIDDGKDVVREVKGLVTEVLDRLDTEMAHRNFTIVVRPLQHRLALVETVDIFLDLSVPDVVKKKLSLVGDEDKFVSRLRATYPTRDFVVQYKESDLAFVSRLCEHLGIALVFADDGSLELHDDGGSFEALEAELPYRARGEKTGVYALDARRTIMPSLYVVRDYNYRTPLTDVTGSHDVPDAYAGGVIEYGAHTKTPDDATALAKVRAELGPLRGVVHAAGALADGVLAAIDAETAVAAQRAKVLGAIWLDELTAADDLSHFVVVTSMAGTLGNPGQAAYAGANTFLDAFAAWRRARGRPGAAFAFGPWAGAGMSERLDPRLRQRLHERGVGSLDPTTAARLLFAWPEASLAVLPMRWPQWLRAFGDVVPPTFRGLQPAAATATPAAAAPFDLAAVPAAERANALRPRVRGAIAAALGFRTPDQLDPERTFRDHGLDSLLAIDAKDRIETLLGIPLPATLLFDHPDLDRLVAHLLAVKFPATSADDGLGSLGDAALARLLADELRRGGDAP